MLPGILLHPTARNASPPGVIESPVTSVTKRLIIYVCKRKHDLSIFVIEFFSIEEMWRYFIMGRGRKGIIEQSERNKKATGAYRETFTYLSVRNREIKKYSCLNKPLIL